MSSFRYVRLLGVFAFWAALSSWSASAQENKNSWSASVHENKSNWSARPWEIKHVFVIALEKSQLDSAGHRHRRH